VDAERLKEREVDGAFSVSHYVFCRVVEGKRKVCGDLVR